MILKSLFTKVECARFLLGFNSMTLTQTIQRTCIYISWSLQIQRHSALAKVLEEQELVIAPARLRDFYKTYILNISNNLWVCLGSTWYSGIMFFFILFKTGWGSQTRVQNIFANSLRPFGTKLTKNFLRVEMSRCDIVSTNLNLILSQQTFSCFLKSMSKKWQPKYSKPFWTMLNKKMQYLLVQASLSEYKVPRWNRSRAR